MLLVFTVLKPPVLAYYASLVVNHSPGPDAEWHVAASDLLAMGLVPFRFVAKQGVLGYTSSELGVAHGG